MRAPLGEQRPLAEALLVIRDRVPRDVQDEAIRVLDAAMERRASVTLSALDDGAGPAQAGLHRVALPILRKEDRHFDHHAATIARGLAHYAIHIDAGRADT